jgi:MFS family permease
MPAFMWSLGTIVGGSMGGYLAEPTKYYPTMFASDGLFGEYPYLLPNLVAVGFIMVAIIQGYFFLKETNPRIRSQSPPNQDQDGNQDEAPDECTPLRPTKRRRSVMEDISVGERRPSFISGSMPTMTEPSFSLRRGSVTTLYSVHSLTPRTSEVFYDTEDEITPTPTPTKTFNRAVLLWILAVVIMCYHQMAFSSLLPIYLLDTPTPHHTESIDFKGGLGYTVHDVGAYMSINGVGALIIQGTIFPVFVGKVGVWRSLFTLIILCPTTYILVPFISLLTPTTRQFGIYAVLLLQNFFMIIIYPCLLIGLKNATPSPLVLGRVNGLAMSACSGARTIAPPLIGIIYGSGGSATAWWSVAAVAGVGIIQLYWLPRPKDDADVVVENVFRKASEESFVRNRDDGEP